MEISEIKKSCISFSIITPCPKQEAYVSCVVGTNKGID